MIAGSFLVTLISAALATPFAVAAALFMTEISPKSGKKILQPVIELLVGIPSVVYGFIGLTVVVPFVRSLFGGTGFGILSSTLVLFVMILPTVTSMSVDALNAVPRHYREASLAMGGTRWQTIYKVVLRAATPGLLTRSLGGSDGHRKCDFDAEQPGDPSFDIDKYFDDEHGEHRNGNFGKQCPLVIGDHPPFDGSILQYFDTLHR